jgi:hypothetical protein
MNICFEVFAATVFNKILSEVKLGTESVHETLQNLVTLTRHPARDDFIAVGRILGGGASLRGVFFQRDLLHRVYIYIYIYTVCKVNQSRYRPGVAQRVPES